MNRNEPRERLRIPRDARHDGLCYLCDVFPTLCTLTGTSLPAGSVEGRSLQPAIVDGSPTDRDELYLAYTDLHRGIRTRTHKLIEYRVDGYIPPNSSTWNTTPANFTTWRPIPLKPGF